MRKTRYAITLLTVWLTILFGGPVLPALASSCSISAGATSPAVCPMKHDGAETADKKACCCCAKSDESVAAGTDNVSSGHSGCACTVKPGVPVTSNKTTQAPLPGFVVALFDVPTIAAIPPLAHFAADAPLPPFAARLRLPQHARDAGRAPPTA